MDLQSGHTISQKGAQISEMQVEKNGRKRRRIYIDALNKDSSNWCRYVNHGRNDDGTNMRAVQLKQFVSYLLVFLFSFIPGEYNLFKSTW